MPIVIAGASRGLGAALAMRYAEAGEAVIALSRTPSDHGLWLPCDLARPDAIIEVCAQIEGPIAALIVVAGIWEAEAFSPGYSLDGSSVEEISRILTVNLQAPILLAKALMRKLRGGKDRIDWLHQWS